MRLDPTFPKSTAAMYAGESPSARACKAAGCERMARHNRLCVTHLTESYDRLRGELRRCQSAHGATVRDVQGLLGALRDRDGTPRWRARFLAAVVKVEAHLPPA